MLRLLGQFDPGSTVTLLDTGRSAYPEQDARRPHEGAAKEAQGKLIAAFESLFTSNVRVIFHLAGAEDVEHEVSGRVKDGTWRSPELFYPSSRF